MRKDHWLLLLRHKGLSTIDELAPSSSAALSPPSSLLSSSGGNERATVTPPFLVLCLLLLLALLLRAACANCSLTITFLYPAYASYKALQSRPRRTAGTSGAASAAAGALTGLSGSDAEVERWLMYWAVVGVWAGVEGCVGWVLTWLPFYTLCKTAIFAYFASGRGIDYVYHTFLEPLFREHEPQIDSFIANLKARAGEGAKGSIGWVWDTGRKAMGLSEQQAQGLAAAAGAQPPTLADPASGAAQQAYGFLSSVASRYMPAALATVSAATSQAQQAVNRSASSSSARGFDVPSETTSASGSGLAAGSGLGYPYTLDKKKGESDDEASGSGGSTANLSGFAEIRREEAEGAAVPPAAPSTQRRTSGGWFWGKDKDHGKKTE